MTPSILLAACALVVGIFIGAVGVGGILLIAALVLLGNTPIHLAAATALSTFGLTGVLGTWLYHRRGSLIWRMTIPLCSGAAAFSIAGAWVSSQIDARPLTAVIAVIIVASGAYILVPMRRPTHELHRDYGRRRLVLLSLIGAVSGFGSGLSGAGGPLFSVPLMIGAGFAPLAAVGAGQVLQVVAALLGTASNLAFAAVDFRLAAWIATFELIGVIVGFRIAHAVSAATLRRLAAVLCVIAGTLMLRSHF